MIEHVVLFRARSDARGEAVDAAMEGLRGLARSVPSVVELTCGKNFGDRAKGYTFGLVVRFRDTQGLRAYLDHPEHRRVVEALVKPVVEDVLALDYEC